jgi:hypothetical protein
MGEYSTNIDEIDQFNKQFFDGMAGIYPLVEESAAKYDSCLWSAGTLVQAVYTELVFEKHHLDKNTILIQHVNAPH